MTQVSKYPVSKEVYERIFDIFLYTLAGLRTKKDVADFLEEFLTPTERVMFAKRFAVAFLLTKGYCYREISQILRVSISTIGFVSLDLKIGKNYKKVVSQIVKSGEIKESLEFVTRKALEVLSAGVSKSGSWRYLKNEIESKRKKKPF